jgi:hypothetical protein
LGTSGELRRLVINSVGNVGIGTTEPTVPLEIAATNQVGLRLKASGSPKYNSIYLADDGGDNFFIEAGVNSTDGGVGNDTHIRTGAGGALRFGTNSAVNQMVIASDGNVGIGTPTPGKKLNIATAGTGGNIELTDTTAATNTKNKYIDSWQGRLTFGKLNDDHTFNAEYMNIDNDGNINVSGGRVNSFGGLVRLYPTWTNNATSQTVASDGFLFGSAYCVSGERIELSINGEKIYAMYASVDNLFCIPVAKGETWSAWRSGSPYFNYIWWRPR